MDEQALIEQFAKTGNLLDILNDDAWHDLDDWDGPTEAGLGLVAYVRQLEALPAEAYRHQRWYVQLLSILWPALRTWLQSWDLGLSFDAVYSEAKRRVYEHLKHLTPEQKARMDSLLAEPDQGTARVQVIPILVSLLTVEDHDALASIAAQGMANGVLLQLKTALPSVV
jgi:hypothetical protein